MAEEETLEGDVTTFRAYGNPLEMVPLLRYLGWNLTAVGDDWPAV